MSLNSLPYSVVKVEGPYPRSGRLAGGGRCQTHLNIIQNGCTCPALGKKKNGKGKTLLLYFSLCTATDSIGLRSLNLVEGFANKAP